MKLNGPYRYACGHMQNRCRQHSENTANQIMPKKVSVLKQVRLTDENHNALIKVKTQAIMPTSLGSLANCAITIALPQLQERFCKTTTTKG